MELSPNDIQKMYEVMVELNRKLDMLLPKSKKKKAAKTDEEIWEDYERKLNQKILRKVAKNK